ncbi:MAG: hypothetical protein JXA89_20390 [Anaerolineae bacterium]|nr:hypothetical protein [Anaerolineae bacterium]
MERCSFNQLCEKLTTIGSGTIHHLFDGDRESFDAASFAAESLSDEFLGSLPFGVHLVGCAKKPLWINNKQYETRLHMLYVIAGVVDTFESRGSRFLGGCTEFGPFYARLNAVAAENGFDQNVLRKICIVSSLYHDLGKAIAGERHPYEGYHIMKDLGQVQTVLSSVDPDSPGMISASKDFRKWIEGAIGGSEETANYFYRFFMKLMRYHCPFAETVLTLLNCSLSRIDSWRQVQ